MTPVGNDPPEGSPRDPGNDNCVTEDDLQAYVDGQLAGAERARIESYLASHPAEAERLAAYRKQNIGLHGLFDPQDRRDDLSDLPPQMAGLAAALDQKLQDSVQARPDQRRFSYRQMAAGLALLLTAGGAGWFAYDQGVQRDDPLVAFTRQALEAHARLAGPQIAATGENDVSGRQVVAWLSKQPDGALLKVPDLEGLGFRLVADRVIATAYGQPAAQLLYQDDGGQRITLYMRAARAPVDTSFTFRREGKVSQFFWQSGQLAYSLIGTMDQDRLLEIAEVIGEELQRDDAGASAETLAPDSGPETPRPTVLPEAVLEIDGESAPNLPGAAEKAGPADALGDPQPAKPELLPLKPLPSPLPEPGSSPKET
ncbi:anti-sigma factor [Pelagibius sp.]|uniref:anti-sigma factor family protein n=1 Tax=Pelagibius sp. TaxID=1931238 RepID=UPI002615C632|nr:hypothetical protein [Pelagibius sp.]